MRRIYQKEGGGIDRFGQQRIFIGELIILLLKDGNWAFVDWFLIRERKRRGLEHQPKN
ncbi:MAG: hypothetical protein KTR13_03300 [Saprospiraceae bacterium]|nr:hypothetical protein [Saprospiraceae bacterium]